LVVQLSKREVLVSKLIVEVEMSLDGVIGGDQAAFWGQVFRFHSADVQAYLDELLFVPDALVMGRQTYQGFAHVWPTRQGKMADRINTMPKYVASRTLKAPLQWAATLIEGDGADGIARLKKERETALLQYGVGELTRGLLERGLVDEVRMLVFPFAFGAGPRVFADMGVNGFTLLETKTFDSGAIVHHYKPDKAV
jgi:dihydrofolate reductase